jgi:hypothetical protein
VLVGHDAITHGLLLSYHVGAGVTLIVHSCREFCAINMYAVLFICTKQEQSAVICLLWTEGVPDAEMHRGISVQYGNGVVSQRIVNELIERFRTGRTSVKHEEGADAQPRLLLMQTREFVT